MLIDPASFDAWSAKLEAQPLREFEDDTFIRRMDRAQRLSRAALGRHFAVGLAGLRGALTVEAIAEAVRQRQPEIVTTGDAWEELRAELRIPLTVSAAARRVLEDEAEPLSKLFALKDSQVAQTWLAAARAVARLDPSEADAEDLARSDPRAQADWLFDRVRLLALSYAERHGADMVVEITAETQRALRLALQRALEEPTTAGQLQRAILSLEDASGLPRLGLTSYQQGIFERWIDSQLSAGTWQDWGAGKIQQAIDRRYAGMVRRRAQLIAQTESLEAGNRGQLATWQEQVRQRAIDSAAWVLEWVYRGINTCRRCLAFDSATREIAEGGMFVSDGSGPRGVETVAMPELHVGGYCQARRMPKD